MTSFTLAILKPDAVANPVVLKFISDSILFNGLKISKGCRLKLSHEQATLLYSIHSTKFFYDRLIRHVCSGPVIVMKLDLRAENESYSKGFFSELFGWEKPEMVNSNLEAIQRWRRALGPSKLFANWRQIEGNFADSDHNNLRQFFAISDTRNVGHGSDSLEACEREYSIFKNLLKPINNPNSELFQLDRFVYDEEENKDYL